MYNWKSCLRRRRRRRRRRRCRPAGEMGEELWEFALRNQKMLAARIKAAGLKTCLEDGLPVFFEAHCFYCASVPPLGVSQGGEKQQGDSSGFPWRPRCSAKVVIPDNSTSKEPSHQKAQVYQVKGTCLQQQTLKFTFQKWEKVPKNNRNPTKKTRNPEQRRTKPSNSSSSMTSSLLDAVNVEFRCPIEDQEP